MEYIGIRNWERWQSYRSDRGQPPWIKVHRCVMRNPEWVSLTDAERGQLVAMWLLAADHNGVIPASPEIIAKLCFMTKQPNISKFIDLGFIMSDGRQCDVNATPNGSHCDSPKAETETDKKREETETHIPLRGQFANVKLTDEQVKKLDERFGESKAKDRIEILSEALASKKGYATKYKDHYATILSWARREGINGKQPDDNGNGGAFMEFIRKKAGLKDG